MHTAHNIAMGRVKKNCERAEQHGAQSDYVLTLLVSGDLSLRHSQEIRVLPGMVTLVPAGVPHELTSALDADIRWLSFCPGCLGIDIEAPQMAAFNRVRLGALPVVTPARLAFVELLLDELEGELARPAGSSLEVKRSLLTLVLNEINRAMREQPSPAPGSDKVVRALAYIQQHSVRPVSLRDVAAAVHLSPPYLASQVKKATGYTVGQWLIRYKLAEACSRLLHTDRPVSEIANEIGWQDVTYFIRQFKKAFGMTPAAWRRRQKS